MNARIQTPLAVDGHLGSAREGRQVAMRSDRGAGPVHARGRGRLHRAQPLRRACPMTDSVESVRGERARKPIGVARVRQPVRDADRLWRARYVDLDGTIRQAGRFERKGDAVAHTAELVARLNREGRRASSVPTLVEFLEAWPQRFPRHPRTQATNTERIRHYLLPLLPERGEVSLDELRRADLRDVQGALLRRRLAKSTIDGAFSALSAMLRDAVDIELIDANPAARLRVRPADPRLNPKRGPVRRRAVPPEEIRAFMAQVSPSQRGCCWAPVMTGCRPGAVRDARRGDRPRDADDLPPPND